MSSDTVPQILLILLFLFLSGLFTLIKFSFGSMNDIRLENLCEENVKNIDLIKRLMVKQDRLNSSLLIADYLSNSAAAGISIIIGYNYGGTIGMVVAILITTILILIFGEITPYALSIQYSEKVITKLTKFSNLIMVLFTPFHKLVQLLSSIFFFFFWGKKNYNEPTITEDELISAVNLSREAGLLDVNEFGIIENIFNFKGSYVREIMTPRMDIVAVEINDPIDDIANVFPEEGYSRIPVYEDDLDNVLGILHAKDLIALMTTTNKDDIDLRTILRQPFFTFEYQKTQTLFAEMRLNRISTAIVLDEYGGTEGLITLEDLIEEIVGEIEDEYDEEEIDDIVEIENGEFSVNGMARISDVNDVLESDLESDEFDTIGGFVIGLFDRFPNRGEYIISDGYKFTITEAEDKRVVRIKIKAVDEDEIE